MGVAIEASADKISFRDVRAAFKELGLDSQAFYEDDTIIGTFNARVADGPKQEPEMRRALKIIGQIRSSEKIQYVASQGESEATPVSLSRPSRRLTRRQLLLTTSKRCFFSVPRRPHPMSSLCLCTLSR